MSITSSANDLNSFSDLNDAVLVGGNPRGARRVLLGQRQARARVEETNVVLDAVVQVASEQRHGDLVLFLLQTSESGHHNLFFIGHQQGFGRLQLHFVVVLFGHFPFVFKSDAGLVLD